LRLRYRGAARDDAICNFPSAAFFEAEQAGKEQKGRENRLLFVE